MTKRQREKLAEIAERNHQTASNLIRIAIDQLISFAEENEGQLPFKKSEKKEQE